MGMVLPLFFFNQKGLNLNIYHRCGFGFEVILENEEGNT
jgi:hypothetical protein